MVVHLFPETRPAGCPPPSQLVVHLVFRTTKIGVWWHAGSFSPTSGFGEIYGSGGVRLLTFRLSTYRGTPKNNLGVHKVFWVGSDVLHSTVDCVKKTWENRVFWWPPVFIIAFGWCGGMAASVNFCKMFFFFSKIWLFENLRGYAHIKLYFPIKKRDWPKFSSAPSRPGGGKVVVKWPFCFTLLWFSKQK